MLTTLQRLGGVLVRPRATIRALRPGVGAGDGLLLLLLYGLGAKLEPLAHGLADFQASQGLSAIVGFALGFVAFLPWVITTLLVEFVLGRERRERTELVKVPLALCAAAGGLAYHLGLPLPGPAYLPELVGAAWTVGLAAWVRDAVVVDPEAAVAPPSAMTRRSSTLAGLLLLSAFASNATLDLREIRARWSTFAPLSVGEPLGDFTVPLLEGGSFNAQELDEGVHLLAFWTTWCTACASEMPALVDLDRRYRERGLRLLTINSDNPGPNRLAEITAYRARHQLAAPIAIDSGALRQRFRVRVFPHIVIIRSGEVRFMHQGRVLASTLEAEVAALLAESP